MARLDLILSSTGGSGGALIWLGDEKGGFTQLSSSGRAFIGLRHRGP
jgi:hypothetical protein